VYNKRKLGQPYQVKLKKLSKELLAAKKNAQETCLRSILRNGGNCWSEFYIMLKDEREIGKLFLLSKTTKERSLRTILKKPTS